MEIRLTEREIEGLREVGKPLARILDDDVQRSLVAKGLIEQRLGGMARTQRGEQWLLENWRRY